MGNITISLKEETENKIREIAGKKYKNKKGSLAKVISDSVELLSKQSEKQRAMERQFRWMDKGFDMGKILINKREELYER